MITQPYWITNQLAIVPRPRGGDWLEDEMVALREAGIEIVVSMLQEIEAAELGLEHESKEATNARLQFVNFAIPDRDTPTDKQTFIQFLLLLEKNLANGKRIGIHCRACIGRASITAASLLIRSGVAPEKAWAQISAARGCPVPDTIEQREWVNQNMRSNL